MFVHHRHKMLNKVHPFPSQAVEELMLIFCFFIELDFLLLR